MTAGFSVPNRRSSHRAVKSGPRFSIAGRAPVRAEPFPRRSVVKKSSRPRLSVQALEGREVPAVVSGSVFLDANNNGHRDCGEAGIPNVQVKLVDVCGCVRGTTTTNCDGDYAFHCVSPGAYKIVE